MKAPSVCHRFARWWPKDGFMDMSQHHLAPPTDPANLSDKPTVFVIDTDATRRTWLGLLAVRSGWAVEIFECAQAFLARPRTRTPSCLVLDFGLSDVSGPDLQRRLADRPELPIIFIYDGDDVRSAVIAMKAGALEVLTGPLLDEEVQRAMRDAIERSRTALARRLTLDMLRSRYASLSSREREVMALVVRGRLNKQIGADLGISEITVKAHRGKMMRKMAVRTVPDIVNMAAKLFPVT
jgi:FixJ family two-component response regulator